MDTMRGDRTANPSDTYTDLARENTMQHQQNSNGVTPRDKQIVPRSKGRATALLLVTVLLLATVVIAGCAPRHRPSPSEMLDPAAQKTAAQLWEQYITTAKARNTSSPFRINASLRYSTPDSGHRLMLMAWGNGVAPVRMDLEAGIGKVVALIRQDQNSFIAYDPGANLAYVNKDSGNALLRFGLPIPFGIKELGHLMAGRFNMVIPEKYTSVVLVPSGGFAYTLPTSTLAQGTSGPKTESVLKLNALAQPEEWTVGAGSRRMILTISNYDETDASLPRKYTIQYGEEKSAVLIIKERSSFDLPYTKEQLALDMPEGTEIKPLPHN